MFLDYLALVILLMGLTLVFYGIIYIHEIPHKIAKERDHPHEEAINVAGWLSLFTLHAIWPIVFIWALMHKKQPHGSTEAIAVSPEADTSLRLAEVERRLTNLESAR